MRIISGIVAAAMLAALTGPAWAVCIIRGGARTCTPDPKYWNVAVGPEKDTSAAAPVTDLKAIVMRPSTSGDDAWVMVPGQSTGPAAPPIVRVAVPACELGTSC